MEETIETLTHLVDEYCSVWNEPDIPKRRERLQEFWEPNGRYVDPRSDLEGVEALVNHIEKIQKSRPGALIQRTSAVDIHHEIGRFHWELRDEDNEKLMEGLDIVYFTHGEKRIAKIIGFFGVL